MVQNMWVEYELVARVAWVVLVCTSRNNCRTAACTYVNPCAYSNPCTFVNPDLPRTVCLFVCDAAAFCAPQPSSVCLSLLFFSYKSLLFYFASFCKPSTKVIVRVSSSYLFLALSSLNCTYVSLKWESFSLSVYLHFFYIFLFVCLPFFLVVR